LDKRDLYREAVLLREQLTCLMNNDGVELERDPRVKELMDQIDELQVRIWHSELLKLKAD